MTYIIDFFIAYILTNVIEFIPFSFLIKKDLKFKVPRLILINSITLPVFWTAMLFVRENYYLVFFISEILICVAEAILIKRLLKQSWKTSFMTSIIMNFLSAAAGFLI